MTTPPPVTLYLDAETLPRVQSGAHNFFKRLIGVITAQGWSVTLRESTLAARLAAPMRPGFAIYHMEAPTHRRAVTCRHSYVGAFWHIEAEAERWNWPVAQTGFDPASIDAKVASGFVGLWRNRLYSSEIEVKDEGFILMPLQGRLLEHRSFQSMAPLQMVEHTLAHSPLPVLATLHPKETYSQPELEALEQLVARHPRLRVQRGGSDLALTRCSAVVTQNSSLAFKGYFLQKPALLFAKIDFHHIAASVPRDGLKAAFEQLAAPAPYAPYLYWFLHLHAINAGRPECEAQILAQLRHLGWPL